MLSVFTFFSCETDPYIPSGERPETPHYEINVAVKDSVIYNGVFTEFFIEGNTNFTKAVYYIDDVFIDSVKEPPYKLRYRPRSLSPGTHTVKCHAIFPNFELFREQKVESRLRLGEKFQGGIVFYLEADELNGLVAADSDISAVTWGDNIEVGANAVDGSINTQKIIEITSDTSTQNIAYHFRNGYNYNEYTDWYVPSIEELVKLKANKKLVGKFNETDVFPANFYYSSTESNATESLGISFAGESSASESIAKDTVANVRPVRKITYTNQK